jgi:multisubunit Na+/H+ antiporter MnhB subunit
MTGLVLEAALALLVLGVAAWTVATRQGFAAVIGFVAYGLLLSLVWQRLGSVDVALTEAALGSGVTGAVLIAAVFRLPSSPSAAAPEKRVRLAAAILSALVALTLAALVLTPPDPAPSLAAAAAEPLPALGLGNPVTAVLMAYRGIDTLLEKVVLLLALLAVWSLAPDRVWGGAPSAWDPAWDDDAPSGAVVLLARLLPPVGVLASVYLLWVSADEPGGAFQGGALLAAMGLLVLMARLAPPPETANPWLRRLATVGPAVFLAVGFLGFALPGGFLSYPPGIEKPVILLVEVPVTLSIAVILCLLAAGPPGRQPR